MQQKPILPILIIFLFACGSNSSVSTTQDIPFTSVSDRYEVCGQYIPQDLVSIDPFLLKFKAFEHQNDQGHVLPYRLFVPENYDATLSYPLVVYLHASSGLGTDNSRHMLDSEPDIIGSHVFTTASIQSQYPSIVLIPQSSSPWGLISEADLITSLEHVTEVIADLHTQYNIDRNRLYAVGLSTGGSGAWDLIIKTDLFAAAVPIGNWAPTTLKPAPLSEVIAPGFKREYSLERIKQSAEILSNRSVWFFYGEHDSDGELKIWWQEMGRAIQAAGGNPRGTEYKNAGPGSVHCAFTEPGLYEWLFTQRRQAP